MMLKERKKNSFQNCTKDRMVHFNISVAVKHSRDIKQPRARKLMFLLFFYGYNHHLWAFSFRILKRKTFLGKGLFVINLGEILRIFDKNM